MGARITTRRDLLTGAHLRRDDDDDGMHISSAVVSVLPAYRETVAARLRALPAAEIHFGNASKLIIVLEGRNSGELGSMLADISGWPGVLSANMVFEQQLQPESGNESDAT